MLTPPRSAALFYQQTSRHVYYDVVGVGHEVLQGKGANKETSSGLQTIGQTARSFSTSTAISVHCSIVDHCRRDVDITSSPERSIPALRAAQVCLSRLFNVPKKHAVGRFVLGTRLERNPPVCWQRCLQWMQTQSRKLDLPL